MLPLKLQLFSVVQSPSSGAGLCLCVPFHSSLFKNALQEYPVTPGGFIGHIWNSPHQKTARNVTFYVGGGFFRSITAVPAQVISDEMRDAQLLKSKLAV